MIPMYKLFQMMIPIQIIINDDTNENYRGSWSPCAELRTSQSTSSSPSAFSSSSDSSYVAGASFVFGRLKWWNAERNNKNNSKKATYFFKHLYLFISGGLLHSEKKTLKCVKTKITPDYRQCFRLPPSENKKLEDQELRQRLSKFRKYCTHEIQHLTCYVRELFCQLWYIIYSAEENIPTQHEYFRSINHMAGIYQGGYFLLIRVTFF